MPAVKHNRRMSHFSATGLLLDVDGPVASPASRAVQPGIIACLADLARAGWPVAFNTGRSDTFVREQLVAPLVVRGIPDGVRFHAVCEKGAVWFSFGASGMEELQLDRSLMVPDNIRGAVRSLVQEKYAACMFVDETKRTTVSVEQRTDVSSADYRAAQQQFDDDAVGILRAAGLGVAYRGSSWPNAHGDVAYRVDPTIISTDVEPAGAGKDLGAERALQLVDAAPRSWITMGDSRTDYAMADTLHRHGFKVSHVDVRPTEGVPDKPYPVLTAETLGASPETVNDDVGVLFFTHWVASLHGGAGAEVHRAREY
jgi:hydroxymethylpyrimidine pyrophosphatase-like HAD family hydrolase